MLNKAVINLDAIVSNAKKVKEKLVKGEKFCAVVKADAYGHGACVVANALYKYADCFAVALLEEALALRISGIDKDILCFTPIFFKEISSAVRYNITATVSNAEHIKMLDAEAKRQNKRVKIQIKFNAGMNRQGVDLNEIKSLLRIIDGCKWVLLDGAYAHLSRPEDEKSRNLQVNKFLLANNLVKGYNNKAICHISASGALLAGVRSDMARIGILLYGYKPFKSDLIDVAPAMKVYAPVLATRKLKKGDVALYGDKIADSDLDISLVRYGYADGLMRKQIKGQFNNRCMDLTAVIGKESGFYPIMENADVLAKKYGTISYDILTKSAIRAEKIYVR